jgi:hypothetical protein
MITIPTQISAGVLAKYSIDRKNLCFSATPKDNPKDLIEVILGDDKDPTTFQPQWKCMRWDNEVNLSLRLKDFDNYTLSTEAEKIKLVTPEKEVHLYDYPISKEHTEGAYEFEVILKEKPATNKIEFTLQDKDVDYFYQPPLTSEEIAQGASQPDNVTGSYAIYAKTPKTNWTGGKEYKCGMIGYIFRPKIIDSVGTEVWGDLNIDTDKGILSVTIPQNFLDNAVYPVRHASGLTFGYTTKGSSSTYYDPDDILGSSLAAPSSNGNVDSVSYAGINDDGQVKGVIVASDKTIVANGVGDACARTLSGDWITATYTTKPSVTSGTNYYPCIIMSTSSTQIYLTNSAATGLEDTSNSFSSPTNPTDGGTITQKLSIYATYTASGGGVTVDATVQTVTSSLPSPTITAVKNVTIQASVQSLTSSLPTPTITTVQNVTVEPSAQTATSSQPSPTITVEVPSFNGYNSFKAKIMDGSIDLDTDTIKVMLVSSSYNFDQDNHVFKSDITGEISGTGYTAGGKELANKSVTQDNENNKSKFDADNLNWSGATFTTRGAVIYKDTGTPTTSPLVAYFDFGGDKSPSSQGFNINWGDGGIVIFISYPV